MSWIEVVDEDDATGELAEVYEALGAARGRVANIMRVHSLKPRTMQAHLDLYMSIMFSRSGLSREERELIATAVSVMNDCPYCVNHHAEALRAYWKDDDRVRRFVDDFHAVELSERQRVLVAFAEKLTEAPSDCGEEDLGPLRRAGLDDEQILCANLVVSYFNFVNRMALGLGVEFTAEEMTGYKY